MEMSLHVKNKNWMAKQMMLKMVRVSNWKVDSCSQTVWESVEASQEEKERQDSGVCESMIVKWESVRLVVRIILVLQLGQSPKVVTYRDRLREFGPK